LVCCPFLNIKKLQTEKQELNKKDLIKMYRLFFRYVLNLLRKNLVKRKTGCLLFRKIKKLELKKEKLR